MTTFDVLIVGCGPVGATLANMLRLDGHSVAIFDRDTEVFRAPRAMLLDDESARIYQSIGTLQQMADTGDLAPYCRHHFVNADRKNLMTLDFGGDAIHGHATAGLMFHQPSLEARLRESFAQGVGVQSFLGYEVTAVDSGDAGARLTATNTKTAVTQEFQGRYIVGADGGSSLVRRSMETERIDLNYKRAWIVMDVLVHDQAVHDALEDSSLFVCRPNGAIVFVKGRHNHVRFDWEVTESDAGKEFTSADGLALIAEFFDASSVEIIRLAPYMFYAGMPDSWRQGRLLLAGDAAHQTSPFAGQGLNMGVRDAANLAFKLDLVLSGRADEALLDTYQEERWDNCASVIKLASKNGQLVSAASPVALFLRSTAFFVARMARKLGRASMGPRKNPPYKRGLLGLTHASSGDSFFQPHVIGADGERCLMDDVIGNGFSLICVAPVQGAAVQRFQEDFGGRVWVVGGNLEPADDKLQNWFETHSVSCVLLRPDRYIFDAGADANSLCDALWVFLQ